MGLRRPRRHRPPVRTEPRRRDREQVLGDSTGRLVVEQFTGYKAVTKRGPPPLAAVLHGGRRKRRASWVEIEH
jgi:hypothetical protein